ncbi:TetR/AcrR family transcriptional regulator [Corynebacterium halotolerans]|uniref:TetR/AcrR family transcriptional regulator n=1 Tax=Corynebacterium halotolerans TaxID=225326 RepID=UPI003CF90377
MPQAITDPTSAPTKQPGRGRPGYDRMDVIRAAVREFNTRGYEATSMGTLAKRLGVSKSAIYHHIASKEEILVEATNWALTSLTEVVEEADQANGSARERLELVVRGAVRVLCEGPERVTLLLRLRGNTEVELDLMERRRTLTRRLINHVKQAQDEGAVRTDLDAGLVGRLAFGMINSIVEWYRPDGPQTPETLADVTAKLVFEGLESK